MHTSWEMFHRRVVTGLDCGPIPMQQYSSGALYNIRILQLIISSQKCLHNTKSV